MLMELSWGSHEFQQHLGWFDSRQSALDFVWNAWENQKKNPSIIISAVSDTLIVDYGRRDAFYYISRVHNTMRKLKECQQCGASMDKILLQRIERANNIYRVKCYCSQCGKSVTADSTEEALEKWNRTRKSRGK